MHIRLENLTKRFRQVTALDGVSCEIPKGKVVAVLGANGAGKTTLLSMLAGLLIPDPGTIYYDGDPFSRRRVDLRKRLYFLPDVPVFAPGESVLDHITVRVGVYDVERPELENEIVETLETLDLLPQCDAKVRHLSRGQQYKAALAGLLVVQPELWLLDEPFASGIDPPAIAEFRRRARRHAAQGGTVVYTTQIVDLAARLSDLVGVLEKGRLVGVGPIHDLLEGQGYPQAVREIVAGLTDSP